MDILTRIKQLVLRRQVIITFKAEVEMDLDNLIGDEVFESIINAKRIEKTIRSVRKGAAGHDKLYIIKGQTYGRITIYTKGKLVRDEEQETFYVLISSKRSLD